MRLSANVATWVLLFAATCAGQQPGSLTGSVLNFVSPYPIDVTLQSETLPVEIFHANADSVGVFRFPEIPVNDYTLKYESLGCEITTVTSIRVTAGERRVLPGIDMIGAVMPREANPVRLPQSVRALPSGDSRGILRGNAMPGGADVSLVSPNGHVCEKTKTDAAGKFTFVVPSPGAFGIRVKAAGYYPTARSGFRIYSGLENTYQPIDMDRRPTGFLNRILHPHPPIRWIQ